MPHSLARVLFKGTDILIIVNLDTETYSELNIKLVGGDRYTRNCELMLISISVNYEKAKVYDLTESPLPQSVLALLDREDALYISRNVPFDRAAIKHTLKIHRPIEQWRCSMVQALSHSFPGALGKQGIAIDLENNKIKMSEGNSLINKFCKPRPANNKIPRYTRLTHPEDWEDFKLYCGRDTDAMIWIDRATPTWNYPDREEELAIWFLDQRINERGIPIDLALVDAAIAASKVEDDHLARLTQKITNGAIASCNKVKQIKEYIADKFKIIITSLSAENVQDIIGQGDTPSEVVSLLKLRALTARTSVKKFDALRRVQVNGRVRNMLAFCGAARTGRWAGKYIQPHNLPRSGFSVEEIEELVEVFMEGTSHMVLDDPMAVASQLVRAAIKAPEGKQLVVADYSNIEGRVLAWVAGCEWKLEAYRQQDKGGHDLYCVAYSKAFGISVEKVTKEQRQIGKVMELACGYQGWLGAFTKMAGGYGVVLPELTAKKVILGWRSSHPEIAGVQDTYKFGKFIVQGLWQQVETACIAAVKNKKKKYTVGKLAIGMRKDMLCIQLPGGSFLQYYRPKIGKGRNGDQVTYMGVHQKTRQWTRLDGYGGLFVENIVQKLARNILVHGMLNADRAGMNIVMHVHDEIVLEESTGTKDVLKNLENAMIDLPEWADGLPVAAEGYEAKRFRKN